MSIYRELSNKKKTNSKMVQELKQSSLQRRYIMTIKHMKELSTPLGKCKSETQCDIGLPWSSG